MPAHLRGEAGEPVSLRLSQEPYRHTLTIAMWFRPMSSPLLVRSGEETPCRVGHRGFFDAFGGNIDVGLGGGEVGMPE